MMTRVTDIKGKHSLFIDTVVVPGTGGVIGMTSCPGRQDDFFFERSDSRLEADIRAIASWGASVIVTLMEEVELEILQVTSLPKAVADNGMQWIHLPIRNKMLPGMDFEEIWSDVGGEIRSILTRGGKILIHCQEGVGRTGIIAARLLIEMGVDADDAMKLVRKARAGALETWPHEKYCSSLRAAV